MSRLAQNSYVFLSNSRNVRLLLLGLAMLGALVSFAAPQSVAACNPYGDGGSCGGG